MSILHSVSTGAVALGLAACVAVPGAYAQCLQSDDFSGQTYGSEWRYLMQNFAPPPYITTIPVPSSSNTMSRYLVLGASAYSNGSDLYPDAPTPNYLGTVLLQPVNPNADWTITTQMAAYAPPGYKSSAGLVLTTQLPPFSSGSQMWRVAEYDSAAPADGTPVSTQIAGLYFPYGDVGQ